MAHTLSTTAQGIAAHIAVTNGTPTTTTLDIAEVYGKRHDDVLRIVRQRMTECPEEWRLRNFAETVTERPSPLNGAPIQSPVIRLTEKGFHFVVGKFTGAKAVAHQIAYAEEFDRMKAALAQPVDARLRGHDANQWPDTPTAVTLANAGAHPNSIDPRALLLGGQTALLAPLPDDVATAIDAKAWDMAREAHTLARQHLLRRVAYSAQVGTAAPRLNAKAAKAAVASTTLGNALAHLYATEVRRSVQAMQAIAQVHQTQLAQAMADLAAMGMGEPL